jgi:hypothetical protein
VDGVQTQAALLVVLVVWPEGQTVVVVVVVLPVKPDPQEPEPLFTVVVDGVHIQTPLVLLRRHVALLRHCHVSRYEAPTGPRVIFVPAFDSCRVNDWRIGGLQSVTVLAGHLTGTARSAQIGVPFASMPIINSPVAQL